MQAIKPGSKRNKKASWGLMQNIYLRAIHVPFPHKTNKKICYPIYTLNRFWNKDISHREVQVKGHLFHLLLSSTNSCQYQFSTRGNYLYLKLMCYPAWCTRDT